MRVMRWSLLIILFGSVVLFGLSACTITPGSQAAATTEAIGSGAAEVQGFANGIAAATPGTPWGAIAGIVGTLSGAVVLITKEIKAESPSATALTVANAVATGINAGANAGVAALSQPLMSSDTKPLT